MAFTTACAVFVIATALASLVVACALARSVLFADAGGTAMREIATAIREGARAFLRRQYWTIALLAVAVAAVLFFAQVAGHRAGLAARTTVAFLVGAASSAASGYWTMFVAVRANARVASAAQRSLAQAARLALRAGASSAIAVVAMSLLGVGVLFLSFGGLAHPEVVPYEIVGFAFGASFVALFAQLGGGIYTKAADIGADLVGKIEMRILEDDPRNPATIADLVGDNVGDCAGRGADLFESAAAENIGAMILGVALFPTFGVAGIVFPLVVAAFGLIASMAGVLVFRTTESADPMSAMNRGFVVTSVLAATGLLVAVRGLLANASWLFVAGAIGLVASFAFVWIARYYTSRRFRPVRSIVDRSGAGAAENVIAGISVALECTLLPVIAIALALLGSYYCGIRALPGVTGAGIYGTAVATTGMLAPVAYVLSVDMLGPIVDNAGGIVEMSEPSDEVRARTDRLDVVGNTAKALTKGYAIGTASLAAFLLLSAYRGEVTLLGRTKMAGFTFDHVDIARPPVFVAGLVGGAIVFLFAALAIRAVAVDADRVIVEARRQFRASPGIFERAERPDYARCVDIVTKGALRGMIAPGLLAALAPIAVGVVLRVVGGHREPALGAEAVASLVLVGTIVAVLLALFMNTGGAAWDNAKKVLEARERGRAPTEAHRAAVVGDTVGDPLKDTAGPSLHVLVKLFGTVSLVAAPLFV